MDKKQIMQDYDFDFLKGRCEHYRDLSLKRPLTESEFKRYKELMKKLTGGIK